MKFQYFSITLVTSPLLTFSQNLGAFDYADGMFVQPTEQLETIANPMHADIQEDLEQYQGETTNIQQMIAHYNSNLRQFGESETGGRQKRAFTGQVANTVAQLDEFGCWCYFYDIKFQGRGEPVDEVDGFCKTLQQGYECAMRDGEDEGETCIPWEVSYTPGSGGGDTLVSSCIDMNPNSNCAARACAVESTFVNSLFALLISGQAIDYQSFSHAQGFDPEAGCATGNARNDQEFFGPDVTQDYACCGYYPERFPYNTKFGEKACCGTRTYSTSFQNCCSTDPVRVKGTC